MSKQGILRRAELHVDRTSPTCIRYTLVEAGKRIWITRAYDHEAGHEGARRRLSAWALAHGVKVVEHQPAELVADVQARR